MNYLDDVIRSLAESPKTIADYAKGNLIETLYSDSFQYGAVIFQERVEIAFNDLAGDMDKNDVLILLAMNQGLIHHDEVNAYLFTRWLSNFVADATGGVHTQIPSDFIDAMSVYLRNRRK